MEKIDFTKIDWWNGEDKPCKEFLDKANIELEKIQNSLNSIPESNDKNDPALDKKAKLLEGLIKHYLDLTKVLDQRRGDYYKAALQMTAIGLTGFGLLIKLVNFSPITVVSLLSISVCLGLLSILVTAFLVIDKYYWQTNSKRYHFLKINGPEIEVLGNSWIWFYHGVKDISTIPFASTKGNEQTEQAGVYGYLKGASHYFENFVKATPRDFYIQNLKHTYLLLIHNAYKNKFDAQLTKIMSIGTRFTFLIISIGIMLSFLSLLSPKIHFSIDEKKATVELGKGPLDVRISEMPMSSTFAKISRQSIQNASRIDSLTTTIAKMNSFAKKKDSIARAKLLKKK